MLAISAVSRCNATGHCEYLFHRRRCGYSVVIHFRTDRSATLLFNFKTRKFRRLFNERRLPSRRVNIATAAQLRHGESVLWRRYSLSGLFTHAALSTAALFVRQSYNHDIQTSDHDACDHDRVKVAALFYRLDQSRRIFRLDHRAGKHFLAEPSQNRTPERRPSQSHHAECSEVHPNDSSRNRNDMTDDWQKPRKENAACFVPVNPLFSPLQFPLAQQ